MTAAEVDWEHPYRLPDDQRVQSGYRAGWRAGHEAGCKAAISREDVDAPILARVGELLTALRRANAN